MRKVYVILFGILVSQQALADLSIPGIYAPQLQASQDALTKAGLAEFQDEVADSKDIKFSDEQIHHAKVWNLTEKEEKRYIQLMQSRSGLYYQGLHMSPVDILGLNARDDAEREHFAELAAKQEAQKVAQNIAWNNAFYEAYNKLFKDIPIIGDFDPSSYSPYAHKPIQLQPGEKLFLFIKPDDAVKTIILQLVDAITLTPNTVLHLLFVGMDDDDIQQWANRQQIPLNLVTSQQITLAKGEQQYQALMLKKKNTPLLLASQGKSSQIIDLGRF